MKNVNESAESVVIDCNIERGFVLFFVLLNWIICECRGKKLNLTDLESWMSKANAPILEHSLRLFNLLKARGVDIILISARREVLRSATIENLVQVGYHGWSKLILRLVHSSQ